MCARVGFHHTERGCTIQPFTTYNAVATIAHISLMPYYTELFDSITYHTILEYSDKKRVIECILFIHKITFRTLAEESGGAQPNQQVTVILAKNSRARVFKTMLMRKKIRYILENLLWTFFFGCLAVEKSGLFNSREFDWL